MVFYLPLVGVKLLEKLAYLEICFTTSSKGMFTWALLKVSKFFFILILPLRVGKPTREGSFRNKCTGRTKKLCTYLGDWGEKVFLLEFFHFHIPQWGVSFDGAISVATSVGVIEGSPLPLLEVMTLIHCGG